MTNEVVHPCQHNQLQQYADSKQYDGVPCPGGGFHYTPSYGLSLMQVHFRNDLVNRGQLTLSGAFEGHAPDGSEASLLKLDESFRLSAQLAVHHSIKDPDPLLLLLRPVDQVMEICREAGFLLNNSLVGFQIRIFSRHQITPVDILCFTHRSLNVVEELDQIMTASIQPAVGKEYARIAVGYRADDKDPDKYHTETG
jgi:hypothetical protein